MCCLQGLLDFCRQPGFIRDMFTNLDCRIERSNMFEAILALLSKTAFPVNCPLGAVHLLSMEGLFSILAALAKGQVQLPSFILPFLGLRFRIDDRL